MSWNCRSLIAAVLFLAAPAAASAQVKLGTPTFGSFSGGPDVVDLANLNIHIPLPIVDKAGRGLPFIYNLGYDTSIWTPSNSSGTAVWTPAANWGFTLGVPAWNGQVTYSSSGSCTYIPPPYNYELCTYSANGFTYIDPNGTSHPTTYSWYEVCDPYCSQSSSGSLLATDDSGYLIDPSGTAVRDRSGTAITTASGSLGTAGSAEDTNGNYISANTSGSNVVITDTLNQTPLTIGSNNTFTIPTGAVTLYYTTYTVRTNFGCNGVSEYGPKSISLVYMIQMPDGSAYTFHYEPTPDYPGDVTGRLSSVSLANGEAISYSYTGTSCTDGSTMSLTRTAADGTWTYLRNGSTTTVTAPQLSYDSTGNQTVYTFDSNGHETQRQIYQGSASGAAVETISTTWDSNDVAPTTTVATLTENNSSATSETDTAYDAYGNLTSKTAYDWGSGGQHGSLLKATTYTYNNSYGSIADLLTEETIADGTGIGYRKDIAYDETAIVNCPSGIPQHDDSNFGCSSSAKRGNPTTVTTYTSPANGQGGIKKTFSYDVFGNEISAQLNCCQQKTWSYSGTTNYAFPDSITSGSSPGLTTKYSYNLSTGTVASVTDPNNLVTNYGYNSTTGLLSSISYPDGHSTDLSITYGGSQCYQDQCYTWPTTRTVTSELTPSESVYSTTYLDEIGRPYAVSTSDSNTYYSTASLGYDALGRQWERSNPCAGYECSSTDWTKTQFDALGRPTLTLLPDNEQTAYNYSVQNARPAVTVSDPTGKKSEALSDALGRLVQTIEDPGGVGYVTTYKYDVLNDIVKVNQGQQTRTYTYDGLGRLVSAAIPEANGATTFSYDNFDNVTSRTDPRGVVTDYDYDGLNRLLGISYPTVPQGVSAMPNNVCTTQDGQEQANVCFYYDQGGAPAFALGNLTEMIDPSGSETYTYDNMGRKTQVQKMIGSNIYATSYQYNYAGEITQITYPSGRQVKPGYDTIGRLASLADTAAGANTTYVSGFSYDPAQHVTQFEYGNGIYGSFGFSPDRLQLTCLDYSATNRNGVCAHDSSTVFGLDYSYSQSGGNNGQISSITDDVDNGRTSTYTYDSLSRLVAATTVGSANYPQWGLSWTYDQYGNRTAQSISAGCVAPMTCPTNSVVVNPGTNQITSPGYGYDANGNMTNDGENTLVYDGEDRVTSSSSQNLGSASYIYDGKGLRVEKCVPNCTSPTSTTVYIYSGSKVIAEYDGEQGLRYEYLYAGGQLVASIGNGGITNGGFEQGLTNWSGWGDSVQLVTNSAQAHSGNDYVQLSSAAGSGAGVSYTQCTPVKPGDQVNWGGWVNLQSGSGGALGWWIAVVNSSGTAIAYIGASNPTSSGWTYQSNTYVMPAGAACASLYAQVYEPSSSTVLWVDDGFFSVGTHYYHQDQLSVRAITDVSGAKVSDEGHFPFGEQWYANSAATKWFFTSYERDAESGNDYAMAREYVNRLGRFSALDPAAPDSADPQSMNRYSYAGNDPINNVDPSGEDFMTNVIIAGTLDWLYNGSGLDGFDEFALLQMAAGDTDWPGCPYGDCSPAEQFAIAQTIMPLLGLPMNGGSAPVWNIFPSQSKKAIQLAAKKKCAAFLKKVLQGAFLAEAGVSNPSDLNPEELQVYNTLGSYGDLAAAASAVAATAIQEPAVNPQSGGYDKVAEAHFDSFSVSFYSDFYSNPEVEQPQVILHEGTHLVYNASDQQLAAAAGVPSTDPNKASQNYEKALEKNCK